MGRWKQEQQWPAAEGHLLQSCPHSWNTELNKNFKNVSYFSEFPQSSRGVYYTQKVT